MRQEKVLRKKARAKEEERLRKQEEHRLQTQRIMQEQQNAIKRRMKEMELAEQARIRRLASRRFAGLLWFHFLDMSRLGQRRR